MGPQAHTALPDQQVKYPEILTDMEQVRPGDPNPLYGMEGVDAKSMRDIAAFIHYMWSTIKDLDRQIAKLKTRIIELEHRQ